MVRLATLLGLVSASVFGYDLLYLSRGQTATVLSRTGLQANSERDAAAGGDIVHVSSTATTEAPTPIDTMLSRLESARERLQGIDHYTARFTQHVRKHGELLEPQLIDLKLQHRPFSVFLRWDRDGQEALFVEGQNEDKLVVHPTRGLARLRRVWELSPDSSLAMREARRPITEIGLLNLVEQLLDIHRVYIVNAECHTEPASVGERSTTCFTLIYESRDDHPDYSKTHLFLCDEQDFPVRIDNFEWHDDGSPGELVESYSYVDLCLSCAKESDFDRENPAYHF